MADKMEYNIPDEELENVTGGKQLGDLVKNGQYVSSGDGCLTCKICGKKYYAPGLGIKSFGFIYKMEQHLKKDHGIS